MAMSIVAVVFMEMGQHGCFYKPTMCFLQIISKFMRMESFVWRQNKLKRLTVPLIKNACDYIWEMDVTTDDFIHQ